MTNLYRMLVVILLIPLMSYAFNSGRFGSKGFLHVQSASTLNKGDLHFRSNLNFYTKVGDYLGDIKPANFTAVNWWDVQFSTIFSYGLVKHFDATLMWRLYQDTNRSGNEYNIPEDFYFDLKAGSFGVSNDRFELGLLASVRLPSNPDYEYNYFFEPYTAGGFEYGMTGLISYFADPYLHDRGYSIHLNLGWYNHNDAGKTLYINSAGLSHGASGNATELQYGLAFGYPTELFNLNLELWGISFLSEPDTMAYSRENFTYITPSVRFKPNSWFGFDLGLDIRLIGDEDTSSPLLPSPSDRLNLPNYPAWRLYLQANFQILPTGTVSSRGDVRSRTDFYERLLRDRDKSQNIEDELRRLRREREQAEKELEELRRMLEEEEK
jgi:hypothetical protein